MTITRSLLPCVALVAALMLAACAGEDTQTTQQGIDQDITATHDAGAPTSRNIGLGDFAPWRLSMTPP
jgi:hypothetical protein